MNQETGVEIVNVPMEGYERLVSYESWRISGLTSGKRTMRERLHSLQKHERTDEVFVVLKGSAALVTAGNGETPGEFMIQRMEPFKLYNVKKGFWHLRVDGEGSTLLIIENDNTDMENSPLVPLTDEQAEILEKMLLQ